MNHFLAAASFGLALSSSALASAQDTYRVSVDSRGIPGDSHSFNPSASADGRYVVFSSVATTLVAGDTNGFSDIFVHDRWTGATTRVSVDSSGAQGNGDSLGSTISRDGRWVAFRSIADDLAPGDTNQESDVFLHDRTSGATTILSVDAAGAPGDGESYSPAISADGRYVSFTSDADNLVPGDTNGEYDVFLRDAVAGTIERVSVGAAGAQGDAFSTSSALSADGRWIAIDSWASNFVAGDTNGVGDIFVRDRLNGTIERVSVTSAGAQANAQSEVPSISADGRFVAFQSWATDLVPGDTNGSADVFLRDRQLGTTTRLSLGAGGVQANASSSVGYTGTVISDDGNLSIFESAASNLVAGDTNGLSDAFVHDRVSGVTLRVSVNSLGAQAAGYSMRPTLSADGRFAIFESAAENLVAGDVNAVIDAFVHELHSNCPPIAAYCTPKTNSQGCTPAIATSGAPMLSGPDAFFVTASDVLDSRNGAFFWGLAPGGTPFHGGLLCVHAPLVRTLVQDSGGAPGVSCSGAYSFHFDQAYMASKGLAPGTHVYGQWWSRDPGFAPPNDVGLSDGIAFTVCP